MISYDEYIKKIKGSKIAIDYSKMYSRIEEKTAQKQIFTFPKVSLAFAGALAVILISFFVYFGLQPSYSNDAAMSYMLEQEQVDGNQVISFIFSE